jgi:hypothetical protein
MTMTSHQVTFDRTNCLIEIEQETAGPTNTPCVAKMYMLEDDGAIVRPIVSEERRQLRIAAIDEQTALQSAIAYLVRRLGPTHSPDPTFSLGGSSFGVPFVLGART